MGLNRVTSSSLMWRLISEDCPSSRTNVDGESALSSSLSFVCMGRTLPRDAPLLPLERRREADLDLLFRLPPDRPLLPFRDFPPDLLLDFLRDGLADLLLVVEEADDLLFEGGLTLAKLFGIISCTTLPTSRVNKHGGRVSTQLAQ
ncbi:hypothetical protein TRVL_05049 [Trypanosoma vivax]|nr:hypothetical protein TRVL_05049 [Trypanosoma vivax]